MMLHRVRSCSLELAITSETYPYYLPVSAVVLKLNCLTVPVALTYPGMFVLALLQE